MTLPQPQHRPQVLSDEQVAALLGACARLRDRLLLGVLLGVTRRGHLMLPIALRRRCGLGTGDRVLLVGEPDHRRLVVHPPASLDAMVTARHADPLMGGATG